MYKFFKLPSVWLLPFLALIATPSYGIYEDYDGIQWYYEVKNSAAVGVWATYIPLSRASTTVTFPSSLGGHPVKMIQLGLSTRLDESKITTVVIPEGVEEVGERLFGGGGLTKVILPSTLKTIGFEAFAGCGFKSISIPDGCESVGNGAFKNSSLVTFEIPPNVKSLGESAFEGCEQLETVILTNNCLTEIATGLFKGCTALKTVLLPPKTQTIGSSAFWDTGIKEINLPDGLRTIGRSAFRYSRLYDITLPASVDCIEEDAFSESDVTHLDFLGDVPRYFAWPIFSYKECQISGNNGDASWSEPTPGGTIHCYPWFKSNFEHYGYPYEYSAYEKVAARHYDDGTLYEKGDIKHVWVDEYYKPTVSPCLLGDIQSNPSANSIIEPGQTIELIPPHEGVVMKYTLDGTDPCEKGMEYTAGILFDYASAIWAVGYWEGQRCTRLYKAVFTFENGVTISFDSTGGFPTPDPLSRAKNAAYGALPSVARFGYDFIGWFTAVDGGEQVFDTTRATKDTTLYAHWLEKIGGAKVRVVEVAAHQRYPWNGKVDIAVTLCGMSNDISTASCIFSATNSQSRVALPVSHIERVGQDLGFNTIWKRRFVWDAAADIGLTKIDDIALTVEAEVPLGGVQLWKNGPYWAECNVGANQPEEYGYYFWWGDTVGYMRSGGTWTSDCMYYNVSWVSCKGENASPFLWGACPTYGKTSAELLSSGYTDSTGNLASSHDAATAHLGAPWRMPMYDDWRALFSNCTTSWIVRNGVPGYLVKGKGEYESKSIFLPAAGYGSWTHLYRPSLEGHYWSSTPNADRFWAIYLQFNSEDTEWHAFYRYEGRSVRPIRADPNAPPCETVIAGFTWKYRQESDGLVLTNVSPCAANMTVPTTINGKHVIGIDFLFNGCDSLQSVSLPDSLKLIGDGTFDNCKAILSIEIPSSVETIGKYAFRGCKTLTAITLPEGLKKIGENAFCSCSNLGSILMTDHIVTIGADAFANCPQLRSLRVSLSQKNRLLALLSASGFNIGLLSVEAIEGVQLWKDGPFWAECNVGATRPEDCGYYFWWGDKVGYKRNGDRWNAVDGSNTGFTFSQGTCPTYDKYNSQLKALGYIDSTTNLVAAHDAATAHLGAPWRMPTDAEWWALKNNCTATWTTTNGVSGCLVSGKGAYAVKSVFFPGNGYGSESDLYHSGICNYWSSTPYSGSPDYSWYASAYKGGFGVDLGFRHLGHVVRPVRDLPK